MLISLQQKVQKFSFSGIEWKRIGFKWKQIRFEWKRISFDKD